MDNKGSANHIPPYIIEPIVNTRISTRLSVLGMTGLSAYFGLIELCAPKANETIVVSGAAGAVGSVVGQIGKILKCRVIGIAGNVEKCHWLTNELNFDVAINYKTENMEKALKAATPNGIDIYFDNVGGEICSTIMSHMNDFGRVALCGSISTYNLKTATGKSPNFPSSNMIFEKLTYFVSFD